MGGVILSWGDFSWIGKLGRGGFGVLGGMGVGIWVKELVLVWDG